MSALQSLMRGWTELAPYNFIHALRFEEAAEMGRWRIATAEALTALDLDATGLALETPATTIDAHFEAELVRGFAKNALPLRFFVLSTPTGHWFGVVVDHWFADDFSCRALLRRIHANYGAREKPALFWAQKHLPGGPFMERVAQLLRASESVAPRLPPAVAKTSGFQPRHISRGAAGWNLGSSAHAGEATTRHGA